MTEHLQTNLKLNRNMFIIIILIFIMLLITFVNIKNLTTYTIKSNIEKQAVIEKQLNTLSEDINIIKDLTVKEHRLLTIVANNCVNLKKDSIIIQDYITTNYRKVPVEIAQIIAIKVIELSIKHDIEVPLVIGLMEIESSFNPFAVSTVGARGLLQVRFGVWKKVLGLNHRYDLHDIETGIESGIRIMLIYLNNSNGNLTTALQKYNGIVEGSIFSNKVYAAMERFESFLASHRKRN